MLSLHSSSVYRSEFDAPETNGLIADGDAAFGQKIFNISVTEVESIVKPNCIANDIWRKSVALISIHGLIISISYG